jgi:putative sigma-54 modulation protein
MEVEFTARQVRISKALRTMLRKLGEEGMERIGRIMGRGAHGSIIFSTQKREQIVEVTVQARAQKIAATGRAETPDAALREALERAESQALRYRDRRLESKRQPKEEKILAAPPVTRSKARRAQPAAEAEEEKPARNGKRARAAIAVHSFPGSATVVEPHIVKNSEAIAAKPMTIEEAVKDAEFGDRDLLIFHTTAGEMYVLHRRRDGQMEMVELP